MDLHGKKLGLVVSCGPEGANFSHALSIVETALKQGVTVYVYCLDDAVTGLRSPRLQKLRNEGVKLFACALAAQRRQIPFDESATFAGLTAINEMIASTDRFLSFN